MSTQSKHDASVVIISNAQEKHAAGIFEWELSTDTVFCDAAAASSFGFNREEGRAGLPIKRFLDRMHPDDIGTVAKAIHESIVTELPYQEDYRICRPDGSVVEVTAYGSCFRGTDGEPHYAGIIFPRTRSAQNETELLQLLLKAHNIAVREGRTGTAYSIVETLKTLPHSPDIEIFGRLSKRKH